jgi:hypothetical protein
LTINNLTITASRAASEFSILDQCLVKRADAFFREKMVMLG